jgi:6-phosphogluconolactonase (cycloisomerase 2 family)
MFDNPKSAAERRRHSQSFSRLRPAALVALLGTVVLGNLAAWDWEARAQPPGTRRPKFPAPKPRNFVYVESNDPAGNAILAYARNNVDGSLTPLPGSPFPTGGLGITYTTALGPFDSDQEVIVNPGHTLLFAVNGGSDTIAVFKINGDGSLVPVAGSPFPSGGSNPVSVGLVRNDVLVVVNQDQDPGHPGQILPNYTSFRVSPQGQLTPVPNSTFFIDAGSSPSQALISPDGDLMFGAEFLGGLLRTLRISPGGRLSLGDVQPLPPAVFAGTGDAPNPLGLAVHPKANLLYVDFVTISQIGVYRYNERGTLQFLRSVPDSGTAPCWALVNQAGTRLYASNTGDSSISVFDISRDPTTPMEIQHVKLKTTGSCFQFALDSTESFLHVVTQQASESQPGTANGLNVLKVAPDGTLTEVPSSPTILPVPIMVRPQGVRAL